jgi:transposase
MQFYCLTRKNKIMKKSFSFFAGIDVSKFKLDVCLLRSEEEQSCHHVFDNNLKGIRQMLKWVNGFKVSKEHCLFCFEHTGIYAMPLCSYLGEQECKYALVSAMEILKSIGVKRGKSDKADAAAIAKYAQTRCNDIRLYSLPEKELIKLKLLLGQRSLLVKTKAAFQVALKEPSSFIDKDLLKEINHQNKQLVANLKTRVEQIEKQIAALIESNSQMKQVYDLLISVPGIGPQIAAYLLVYTRCFTLFDNSRKFACYAGIAPFEYQSGISIKGKSRVSHLANKRMKSLLNLAALTARKTDAQIKNYYERKVKEGKNPMLVLNNIRNKLVARIFATVKRQTPYVFTMQFAA